MMSALLRSSTRLFSKFARGNRTLSSTVASKPRNATIISSAIVDDLPPPPEPEAVKSSRSFLKYGVVAAITGTAATAGYATYAYSLSEIDEKAKGLRASANVPIGDDANSSDKFKAYLHSAAMTVSAKLAEAYIDLRSLTEEHVRGYTEPLSDKLLPDLHPSEQVFTLVLDLHETLIYADWKRDRGWRTFKRPGVDAFLEHLGHFYEIVLYTDQQSVLVEPIVERLDPKHIIIHRLARGATRYIDGKHYRDLSKLNRDPKKVLYLSGHALESSLQPENSVPIKAWQGETEDTVLLDLIPFLEYVAYHPPADIRTVLASYQGCDIPKEFVERSKQHQRRMQEQKEKQHGRPWRLG